MTGWLWLDVLALVAGVSLIQQAWGGQMADKRVVEGEPSVADGLQAIVDMAILVATTGDPVEVQVHRDVTPEMLAALRLTGAAIDTYGAAAPAITEDAEGRRRVRVVPA